MTMRLGLFSRSQHLDLAGYRMQCGTDRQAALWKKEINGAFCGIAWSLTMQSSSSLTSSTLIIGIVSFSQFYLFPLVPLPPALTEQTRYVECSFPHTSACLQDHFVRKEYFRQA
jgi:hypothetical protein